ncbi:hypothetical protein HKK52_26505 [Pseudomonas sp. ADAK2]|uniref:hypothetical protein n=1 Tax=unclassified Pseudomonas TaxID=196821 RepID=UPI0014628CDD|nr:MULTISPECIES: hypothetical protein [unclassified Pseudomonas]QJI44363.1 hypothetical protein HKK53_26505 [Pseudomonas sp. ADAK7]QJI50664.1 hypothetical protein HKK52_26505 [Pseudomonas sp. ADAK2]
MKKAILPALIILIAAQAPAYAINDKYRKQLEQSGCTQVSETQGCDIHKSKAENAKAGFTNPATDAPSTPTPYVGQWVAKSEAGATVATIRIDAKEQVWVNGKRVNAKRTDGTLQFRQGKITFTIQGDRRLQNQDYWMDSDAGTKGPIQIE